MILCISVLLLKTVGFSIFLGNVVGVLLSWIMEPTSCDILVQMTLNAVT